MFAFGLHNSFPIRPPKLLKHSPFSLAFFAGQDLYFREHFLKGRGEVFPTADDGLVQCPSFLLPNQNYCLRLFASPPFASFHRHFHSICTTIPPNQHFLPSNRSTPISPSSSISPPEFKPSIAQPPFPFLFPSHFPVLMSPNWLLAAPFHFAQTNFPSHSQFHFASPFPLFNPSCFSSWPFQFSPKGIICSGIDRNEWRQNNLVVLAIYALPPPLFGRHPLVKWHFRLASKRDSP